MSIQVTIDGLDTEVDVSLVPNRSDLSPEAYVALRGLKGDKGDDGIVGRDGVDGVGITNITQNEDGTLSINLDDGTSYVTEPLRGEDGRDGQDGAKGDTGDDGNGIASAELNSDYTLTLTFTDGTSYTTPSIRGEKGEKGDRGDAGVVDTAMSDTSTSAVQNRVIKAYVDTGLSSKADTSTATTSANGLMSSADKTKLDGIADGAEKNYVTGISPSTSSPDQDQTNYTDYTLSYRMSGDISSSIHVPNTNVATTAKRGLMSSADKTKLDGIESGAQVNPTKLSQLTNDAGYLTSYTETDPVFTASAAHGISSTDIGNWDNAFDGNIELDTTASSGDDYDLTQILTTLGWLNDVIV